MIFMNRTMKLCVLGGAKDLCHPRSTHSHDLKIITRKCIIMNMK